jgi:hypothetical protein
MSNKEYIDRYLILKVGNLYVKSASFSSVTLTEFVGEADKIDEDFYSVADLAKHIHSRIHLLNEHGLNAVVVRETVNKNYVYNEIDVKDKALADVLEALI